MISIICSIIITYYYLHLLQTHIFKLFNSCYFIFMYASIFMKGGVYYIVIIGCSNIIDTYYILVIVFIILPIYDLSVSDTQLFVCNDVGI
jgi:hypothetical protein